MFLEEGVPFVTVSRLHLIISVEALQGGSGDVDFPVEHRRRRDRVTPRRHQQSSSSSGESQKENWKILCLENTIFMKLKVKLMFKVRLCSIRTSQRFGLTFSFN